MPEPSRRKRRPVCRLPESTRARTALGHLVRTGCETVAVLAGGRARGAIDAGLLRRAIDHGLGVVPIGDLWSSASGNDTEEPDRIAGPMSFLSAVDRRRLRTIGRMADDRGEQAFLVGGVVRDALLGSGGSAADLDVVVVGDAIGLARRFARREGGRMRTHASFGTATVRFEKGSAVDLAESRTERYARPGALPRVSRGDLRADLARRDFGVNAIAMALAPGRFGRLVDPCAGRADLRRRCIRVLHGLSLVEDPTRVFRAIRLAHRSGLSIEHRTAQLIEVARRLRVFDAVSGARLRRELSLLFSERGWAKMARRLDRFDLWVGSRLAPAPDERRYATLRRLEQMATRSDSSATHAERWVPVIALLNSGRTRGARVALADRLHPDRAAREVIVEGPTRARRILTGLRRQVPLRPSRVVRSCKGEQADVVLLAGALSERRATREALSCYLTRWRHVRPDIDGKDLLDAGVAAGRAVGTALEAALAAKLDRPSSSRKRQLQAALRATGA